MEGPLAVVGQIEDATKMVKRWGKVRSEKKKVITEDKFYQLPNFVDACQSFQVFADHSDVSDLQGSRPSPSISNWVNSVLIREY